jgi:hypothetical protein
MEIFDIFHGHLVYYVLICYVLLQLGIFFDYLLYFLLFGISYEVKYGNPDLNPSDSLLHEVPRCKVIADEVG